MRILTLSPDELKLVQTFYYVSKEMVWMLICCPTLSFCVVKFALDRWVNAIFCKFYWCVTEIRFIWSVVVLHIKKHVLLSMLLQPYEMIDLIWFDLLCLTLLSAISWRPVLVVEEAGVLGENHRPWASNWYSLFDFYKSSEKNS
jgi:hypothetical protein